MNAAGTVTSGATSDVIGLVTGPSSDTGYATDISYTNAVLQKNLTGVTWGRVGEWVSNWHIFSFLSYFIISYHLCILIRVARLVTHTLFDELFAG